MIILLILFLFCQNAFSQSWEADRRMTNYPSYYDYGSYNNARTIAVQDSFVHIAWEHRNGLGELYYVRSKDYGINFEAHQKLTTQDSHYPSIAISGSFVHTAWMDCHYGISEIYYKRSTDYGSSWEPDVRITDDPATSCYPSICCSDSFVHIAWYDTRDGNTEIYYKRSTDYGVNWEPDVRLTYDPATSCNSSICCMNNFVHITWYDHRDGNTEIYYKRSTDYGFSWEPDVRLTYDPANSSSPSICCTDSFVYIAWDDTRDGNTEVYYKRSTNNGFPWQQDIRLTYALSSEAPSICCMDSIFHIAWMDCRDDSNPEIYYKGSTDYGFSWSPDERLTSNPSYSTLQSIACNKCPQGKYDIHIVWTDKRDGNQEIYYKRHSCAGGSVEESCSCSRTTINSYFFPGGIKFNLSNSNAVIISVFDVSGRLIDELNHKSGHSIIWKNKPGIYFFLFKINNSRKLIKTIIL